MASISLAGLSPLRGGPGLQGLQASWMPGITHRTRETAANYPGEQSDQLHRGCNTQPMDKPLKLLQTLSRKACPLSNTCSTTTLITVPSLSPSPGLCSTQTSLYPNHPHNPEFHPTAWEPTSRWQTGVWPQETKPSPGNSWVHLLNPTRGTGTQRCLAHGVGSENTG